MNDDQMERAALWWSVWTRLCQRFNREADPDEAQEYLEWLEAAGMAWPEIRAAARAVWATREFFPRPADFLTVGAGMGWRAILEVHRDLFSEVTHDEARRQIPERAWSALTSIGGPAIIRDSRDLLRTRSAFLDAYEAEVALADPEVRKALAEAGREKMRRVGASARGSGGSPERLMVDAVRAAGRDAGELPPPAVSDDAPSVSPEEVRRAVDTIQRLGS